MPSKRNRKIGSVTSELLSKSREAAMAAVQIFNNPSITFKSESYIVLMNIAWTYLLHAYYRINNIEYRYYKDHGSCKRFDKTKRGAFKHWELERCLNEKKSPIDNNTTNNLRFLIGLRHEIEHQMTSRIDDLLSSRFQACCLNYNQYIKTLFNDKLGIEKHLSFSLQFSTIRAEQKELLEDHPELSSNIQSYIRDFDAALTEEEFESQCYAYRILFVQKTVNRKGQADRVIEFVKSDSPLAKAVNTEYMTIKEIEKKKYVATQIVNLIQSEGFPRFTMYNHTQLWKKLNAKNPSKGYGCMVAGKYWHWYNRWLEKVREHCKKNIKKYTA